MVEEHDTEQQAAAKSQALALLGRAQGIRADVEQARNAAGAAGQAHLSSIITKLIGAEVHLAQAADTPALSDIDLSGFDALLNGSEQEAASDNRVASASQAATSAQGQALIAAATRKEMQELSGDLFTAKIFDRYLHFGSAEDEQDYRQREAARQQAIAQQLALHKPAGDLNAGGLEAGQMLDAGAHGAAASPDFMPRWNRLVDHLHQERELLRSQNEPTAQFDATVRTAVRSALQKQGVPEDQIERVLASDDPLQAATPYVAGDHSHALEKALEQGDQGTQSKATSAAAATPTAATPAPTSTGSSSIQVDTDFASGATETPSHGLPEQPRRTAVRPTGRTIT